MIERKRAGRPPLEAAVLKSADVHLRLSSMDYDAADQLAKRRRESIQDLLRHGLQRLIGLPRESFRSRK